MKFTFLVQFPQVNPYIRSQDTGTDDFPTQAGWRRGHHNSPRSSPHKQVTQKPTPASSLHHSQPRRVELSCVDRKHYLRNIPPVLQACSLHNKQSWAAVSIFLLYHYSLAGAVVILLVSSRSKPSPWTDLKTIQIRFSTSWIDNADLADSHHVCSNAGQLVNRLAKLMITQFSLTSASDASTLQCWGYWEACHSSILIPDTDNTGINIGDFPTSWQKVLQ